MLLVNYRQLMKQSWFLTCLSSCSFVMIFPCCQVSSDTCKWLPHVTCQLVRSTLLPVTGGRQIAWMGVPPVCGPGPSLIHDISTPRSSNETNLICFLIIYQTLLHGYHAVPPSARDLFKHLHAFAQLWTMRKWWNDDVTRIDPGPLRWGLGVIRDTLEWS